MQKELLAGEVVLVGGGPGDPDLLTVAGLRAIQQAEVIVHDRLGPLASLEDAMPGAEIINVGKIPRGEFTPQERINEILIQQARQGRKVVRLKGGDSFVFGRGGEEWQACIDAGVPVRVVPGVTSAVSVPALAGIPVTHRNLVQGFTVVSGHVPPSDPRSTVDWGALAKANTTLVLLMAVKNLGEIADCLVANGMAPQTSAAVVADGSTDQQSAWISTLGAIGEVVVSHDVRPPAIAVIGDVAGLGLA